MGIARQSQQKGKSKKKAKVVDLTGKKVYPPPDNREKHFNFKPPTKDGRGGLYYEG